MRHVQHGEFEEALPSPPKYRSLLAALRDAHQRLIAEMANMEALTREDQPDRLRFSQLRWKLSQASLVRRTLSGQICEGLEPIVGQADRTAIRDVRAADRQLARQSAAHIGRWTADSIQANWPAYCQASREIRWQMEAHLGFEQQFLVPILERLARSEGS